MRPFAILIAAAALWLNGTARAQWASSGFNVYWPEVVFVAFIDTPHHTWSDGEKGRCAKELTKHFRARGKVFIKQQVPGIESIGDIHRPVIVKSRTMVTDDIASAHITVAVEPTVATGARGEVSFHKDRRAHVRIRPDSVRMAAHICEHEGGHLVGLDHD